jgi:4-amino-4-deoxy-L-arabinose transferase-like glycosyltransferase
MIIIYIAVATVTAVCYMVFSGEELQLSLLGATMAVTGSLVMVGRVHQVLYLYKTRSTEQLDMTSDGQKIIGALLWWMYFASLPNEHLPVAVITKQVFGLLPCALILIAYLRFDDRGKPVRGKLVGYALLILSAYCLVHYPGALKYIAVTHAVYSICKGMCGQIHVNAERLGAGESINHTYSRSFTAFGDNLINVGYGVSAFLLGSSSLEVLMTVYGPCLLVLILSTMLVLQALFDRRHLETLPRFLLHPAEIA